MANGSKPLFEAFRRKGLADRDALFAVIDHFNEQHWHDRNAYGQEIKRLKGRVAALEGKGRDE